MRKLVVLVLGALIVCAFSAISARAFPHWENVKLRTQQLGTFGFVDSLVSSGSGAMKVDTTAAIPKEFWTPLRQGFIRSAPSVTIPDTVAFFALVVAPTTASGITTGADSINVNTQVSLDGRNWVTATVTDNAIAGGPIATVEAVVELASSNTFGLLYEQVSDDAANGNGILTTLAGSTAPSDQALWAFPFIRFIITNDINGQYDVRVGYWKYSDFGGIEP